MSAPDPNLASRRVDRLLELLDLEELDRDMFRGYSPPEAHVRVFGGQVAAQALVAATRTVPDKLVHSLHAYFLRPGDPGRPIVYEVDRIRDGKSYTTRRVVGIQNGKAILNLQASFHVHEEGYAHQEPFPTDVPGPEGLTLFHEWADVMGRSEFIRFVRPIEVRVVLPVTDPFHRYIWFRAAGRMGDDPTLHRCVAAYASDVTLLNMVMQPHGFPEHRAAFTASLDHAMWFHRPFRADEWLLYAQETPSATDGRGLTRGNMFNQDGELVVSVVQEGAVRPPRG